MIAFAKANKIPVEASAEKPYSTDRNLLHISFESGMLKAFGCGKEWFLCNRLRLLRMLIPRAGILRDRLIGRWCKIEHRFFIFLPSMRNDAFFRVRERVIGLYR